MTRINLIPPAELTRNHLIAEYRELPRIVANVKAAVALGKTPDDFAARTPAEFTMGTGHMLFFYTRLGWLLKRFDALVAEMRKRGYEVNWPDLAERAAGLDPAWMGEWAPDEKAIAISRARIEQRLREPVAAQRKGADDGK